jgi:hypothetical protein
MEYISKMNTSKEKNSNFIEDEIEKTEENECDETDCLEYEIANYPSDITLQGYVDIV